jgi:hypothetical protein
MDTYKIEKGVPLPDTLRTPTYPFKEMEIGDSFFVESRSKKAGIHSTAKHYGITITIRKQGSGFRVWRVA